jgi:hypothetical protein
VLNERKGQKENRKLKTLECSKGQELPDIGLNTHRRTELSHRDSFSVTKTNNTLRREGRIGPNMYRSQVRNLKGPAGRQSFYPSDNSNSSSFRASVAAEELKKSEKDLA